MTELQAKFFFNQKDVGMVGVASWLEELKENC